MRRFLVFLLLGPLIGFAVFAVRDILGGKIYGGPMGLLVGLPFAYVFGLPIVLVMWFEDWLLEGKMGLWPKLLTSAITGYAGVIALLVVATSRPLSTRGTAWMRGRGRSRERVERGKVWTHGTTSS